ncbi:hypothetical protein PsYK624_137390 [Phanerochaete sordida]|uniref:Uncharacterized protein n=1 Tax=Phanerochaete sordida TaxID=48140 RepID=A0A9P3GKE3_9APHY|nr:hypothetical protein PsYK624_137390 [Phanerochaete sordida]
MASCTSSRPPPLLLLARPHDHAHARTRINLRVSRPPSPLHPHAAPALPTLVHAGAHGRCRGLGLSSCVQGTQVTQSRSHKARLDTLAHGRGCPAPWNSSDLLCAVSGRSLYVKVMNETMPGRLLARVTTAVHLDFAVTRLPFKASPVENISHWLESLHYFLSPIVCGIEQVPSTAAHSDPRLPSFESCSITPRAAYPGPRRPSICARAASPASRRRPAQSSPRIPQAPSIQAKL